MTAVTFSRVFAAAHRVWSDPGKCRNIHGHNYHVEVTVDLWEGALNDQGFITPFDAVKRVIDAFDHTLILDVDDPLAEALAEVMGREGLVISYVAGPPSTESLAQLIAQTIHDNVVDSRDEHIEVVVTVSLRETDGIEATARATGDE